MNSIPLDPALPALQELFPPRGAPPCVAEWAQEVIGAPVSPESACLRYVHYRPTRDCVALWSFPRPLGEPLLVSGLLGDRASSGSAYPSFRQSAEVLRNALGPNVRACKYFPDRQLLLQVFPLDIRLPGLALAASATWVRGPFCQFLGLSGEQVRIVESIPVRYKPWRRCTLRYVVELQGRRVRFFGKVFHDDRGEPMVARLRALGAQLHAAGAAWDIAAPVTYVSQAGMLVLAALEDGEEVVSSMEKAVHDVQARRTLQEQVARMADGLLTFQTMVVEGLPFVGPEDVLGEHEKKTEELLQVAPTLAESIRSRLVVLATAARRLPAEEMVLSHGAFRLSHILCREEDLFVLDYDGLRVSGASADAGEFLGQADLTALKGPDMGSVVSDCQDVFLACLRKYRRIDPRWLAWHRAASHLKWALHQFVKLKPRWPEVTAGLLRVADDTLAELPV
jgi:hypothetical protein